MNYKEVLFTSSRVFTQKLTLLLLCAIFVIVTGKQFDLSPNGKFRVCVVESRGVYRKASRFCPTLDRLDAPVECVLGADRLDCVRRIGKGTADFAVFSAEDLLAARWSGVEILVTSEMRFHDSPFEYEVVAVVNNDAGISTVQDLRDSRLCHPGHGYEADWTEVLANYFENSLVPRQCDPTLSLAENRIKASSMFFESACKAGPWVPDILQDRELKKRYPSLCSLCYSPNACSAGDKFWGRRGPLYCLTDGQGQVAWARLDDVHSHFGMTGMPSESEPNQYSLLCPDGHLQPLDTKHPCVWVAKPWPAVAARRSVASSVQLLVAGLNHDHEESWKNALLNLIETHHVNITTLDNVIPIDDYLDQAVGFQSAYSFASCNPPRSITICTSSTISLAKCTWMQEAASVQGVEPDIRCDRRLNESDCLLAVSNGELDLTIVQQKDRANAERLGLTSLLFEYPRDMKDMYQSAFVVNAESGIHTISDLKDKRVCFASRDGAAWFSALDELRNQSLIEKVPSCKVEQSLKKFFSEMCVPGGSETGLCGINKEFVGEQGALRCLVEGKADVAVIGLGTVKEFTDGASNEKWARYLKSTDFRSLCRYGKDSSRNMKKNPCLLSWTPQASIMVRQNATEWRKEEIHNAMRVLDSLFGKYYKAHTPSFALYAPFDIKGDVLFHDTTAKLMNRYDIIHERHEHNFEFVNRETVCPSSAIRAVDNTIFSHLVISFTILRYCVNYL